MSRILVLIAVLFLSISSVYAETLHDTIDRYWSQADSAFTKASEINSSTEQDKLLQEAISDYTKLFEIAPNFVVDSFLRGIVYFLQGNLSRALSDYTKTIELHSGGEAEAYYCRGNAYVKQGNLPQAMNDFNKAIELKPLFPEFLNNRGRAYGEQGNFIQAITDFSKAIESNPKFSEAYFERGFIYYKQGNLKQAIADFNKAIEINPNYTDTYYSNDPVYYEQKKHLDAISDYIKVTEINPKLAKVYASQGNFNKAIAIDPYYAQAYSFRAKAYYNAKEYNKAWEDVNTAEVLGVPAGADFIELLKTASSKEQ